MLCMIKKKISIITPVFNEEENIIDCSKSVKEFFLQINNKYDYEHIFVDNSSTDSSLLKMRELSITDKNVKILVNNQNYGILPSIFNALKYCKSDYTLVCYAADLQDPIDFLFKALKKSEQGYEIIYAKRNKRYEKFFYKYLKKTYYYLAKKLTNNILKQNVSSFQLISDKVRKEILTVNSNNPFIPYIIQSTTFKKIGIETVWLERKKNIAKNNFFSLMDEAINAICNYSGIASKISFILSFTLFTFSIIFLIYNVVFLIKEFFVKNIEITSGIPSIIIFNCIMFATILVILGILSENVNHLLQAKIGKKVNINEKINFD